MNPDENAKNPNRRRLRLARAARPAASNAAPTPDVEESPAQRALRPERLSVVEAYVDAYPADAAQRARANDDLRGPAQVPYPVEAAAG